MSHIDLVVWLVHHLQLSLPSEAKVIRRDVLPVE